MDSNDDVQVVRPVSWSSDVRKSVQDCEMPVGMRFAVEADVGVGVPYDK